MSFCFMLTNVLISIFVEFDCNFGFGYVLVEAISFQDSIFIFMCGVLLIGFDHFDGISFQDQFFFFWEDWEAFDKNVVLVTVS